MAKFTARRDPWGRRRFPRPDLVELEVPQCIYRDCMNAQLAEDILVCGRHAMYIGLRLKEILGQPLRHIPSRPIPKNPEYVYYLMIGPATVKIGTTTDLPLRLNALRTEAQYVVAIERGSYDLESQRHKEFADERIGRRENFQLSERLKTHIETLQPQRDELVAIATTYPLFRERQS